MTTDVILKRDKGYYDIEWDADGDINTDQALDAFVLICLFEERRASPAEVAEPRARRGWIGNESTPGFEQGSKVWRFSQERVTGSMLAELGPVVRNSLQPVIDEGLAADVIVEDPKLKNGQVVVSINFKRHDGTIDRRFYELWENTGGSF